MLITTCLLFKNLNFYLYLISFLTYCSTTRKQHEQLANQDSSIKHISNSKSNQSIAPSNSNKKVSSYFSPSPCSRGLVVDLGSPSSNGPVRTSSVVDLVMNWCLINTCIPPTWQHYNSKFMQSDARFIALQQ